LKEIGYEEGHADGYGQGRSEGIDIGREQGIGIGREQGIDIGREQGIGIGREQGRSEGIMATISLLKENGFSNGKIAEALVSKFALSPEDTQKYLTQADK
ncbi:MAG: hypothetical protein NC220_03750, partial [Clostridium sp.]|nr:hypothetical protein [Clostridium sp.]